MKGHGLEAPVREVVGKTDGVLEEAGGLPTFLTLPLMWEIAVLAKWHRWDATRQKLVLVDMRVD